MAYTKALILAENESGLTVGAAQTWEGGVGAIVAIGSAFPTTCQVQLLGPNGSTYIDVGANITANSIQSVNLPAGSYRLNKSGGTATALYIRLVSIPR